MGIVVGVLFSVVLFLFLSHSYFTSNIISSSLAGEVSNLPQSIFNFYSLFIASISVATGIGETQRIWFHKPRKIWSTRKNRSSEIYSEQRFLHYSFLGLLLRALMLVFFIFGGYYSTAFIVEFHNSFGLLFFLIPLVLFFSSWLRILKTYKQQAQKWMLLSFLISIFFSISLAQLNNTMHNRLYNATLQFDPIAKHGIDLPQVVSWNNIYRRSLLIEGIKMTLDKNGQVCYFIGNSQVLPEAIEAFIKGQIEITFPSEKHRLTCLISADKNINMETLDAFKSQLWTLGVKNIAYIAHYKPISNSLDFYPRYIFKERIQAHHVGEAYLDDQWKGFRTTLNLSDNGKIEIDGIAQPIENIEPLLFDIKTKHPVGLIEFEYQNTTTLGDYLKVISAHKKVFKTVLETKARSGFGESYENLEYEQRQDLRKENAFYFTTTRVD